MSEKLQKVLARAGLGSRRQLERWIEQGRVSVDGRTAQLGDRVTTDQKLMVDGKSVSTMLGNQSHVLLYHKPEGEICTRDDPAGRPTVFSNLAAPRDGRWVVVGRLDLNTAGLLLFTTHGELANRLMHPRYRVVREYAVRVLGQVDAADLKRLKKGVVLDDGPARFQRIEDTGGEGANHWYRVQLAEGRNREVRRMWEAVGARVSRLIRIRFGPVILPRSLHPGQSRELGRDEVEDLLKQVGLSNDRPDSNSSATRVSAASNPDEPRIRPHR
ncbi:MAG TPA: pseudouridine synthase [Acidiferrobacteraceae bacterium]|nr:pseudouridine synthase [Acidiferrobacteraceae bacterium]